MTRNKSMDLQCDYISASEEGDYFQVLFKGKTYPDSDDKYFLIQRGFELDDKNCYIECHDYDFAGHYKINKCKLIRNNFYIEVANKISFNIAFNTSEENLQEVKKVLKIILSDFNRFEIGC